jgi:hypothetical protein
VIKKIAFITSAKRELTEILNFRKTPSFASRKKFKHIFIYNLMKKRKISSKERKELKPLPF